jgi:hypothetical protein
MRPVVKTGDVAGQADQDLGVLAGSGGGGRLSGDPARAEHGGEPIARGHEIYRKAIATEPVRQAIPQAAKAGVLTRQGCAAPAELAGRRDRPSDASGKPVGAPMPRKRLTPHVSAVRRAARSPETMDVQVPLPDTCPVMLDEDRGGAAAARNRSV